MPDWLVNVVGLAQVPPVPPPLVLNVAVTERDAVIASTQLPVPEHEPLHPAKADPLAAAADNVTEVPFA